MNLDGVELPDRKTWLAARRISLGASEAATALGQNPWSSPYELWCHKTGRVERDGKGNEAMEWGLRLEDAIANAVADRTGRRVEMQPSHRILYHPEHGYLSATLDALQWDPAFGPEPGVLQIKTSNAFGWRKWKEEGTPLHYRIQLQQEIAVSGATWGSVAVLIGGQRLLGPFDEYASEHYEEAIVPALAEFWRAVEHEQPPAVDNSEATARALQRFQVEDQGEPVILSEEANDAAERYREIRQEIKALEEEKRGLQNLLMAEVLEQDARLGMLTSGGCVQVFDVSRGGYTVAPTTYRRMKL